MKVLTYIKRAIIMWIEITQKARAKNIRSIL